LAEGQKAFVKIDRPSIAEFSVLWLMVVLKRASTLGLSYTMNVSYTVSFSCIKLFSFYPRETNFKRLDAEPLWIWLRGDFLLGFNRGK